MATIEEFTYDDPFRGYRRGKRWIPSGSNMPAVIYCSGHGWNGRTPDEFFDPTSGQPFFTDQIEPKEGTDPVACFAIWTASAAYDYTGVHPQWSDGSDYTEGDLVRQGVYYRCIDTHVNSTTATHKPGTGTNWEEYWYAVDLMECGDALQLQERHHTPAFLESNQLDVQAVFAHVVENAAAYGIDPGKIFIMGSSAGGQQAGTFAFGQGGPYVQNARPARGNKFVPTDLPKPAGAILHWTPNDFTWYDWGATLGNLFNIRTNAEWLATRDERKAALSPLGTLKSTAAAIPTFLDYNGQGFYDDATDQPPYSGTPFHQAKNGWEMFKHLADTNGQADVTFVEDHPTLGSTLNVWNSANGTASADHTIADTDADAEMWDWFAGLTGLTPNP